MMESSSPARRLTRRNFVRSTAAAGAAFAFRPLCGLASGMGATTVKSGPHLLHMPLNEEWTFCGKAAEATQGAAGKMISLPHCVAKLSWQDWDPASWQDVWLYRRHLALTHEFEGLRTFVKFDAAMVTADVSFNRTALPTHQGGYLPFTHELTQLLKDGNNLLEVRLDSRFLSVPPEGSPRGPHAVDYFVPGGLIRGASLFAVPQAFLSDVFAKPVDVLTSARRVDLTCTIDSAVTAHGEAHLEAVLMEGGRVVARARKTLASLQPGKSDVAFTMTGLGDVKLWDVDTPHLYDVIVELHVNGQPVHDYRTRIGFREAKFTADGFFLNGRKFCFFGLNRHELYPYTGYAMPARVMRRDAEILRHEFNCNTVRCSHYPQNEAFLEACDELGLMVWQETPGWSYIGDAEFEDQVVQNVGDMIRRDRNHPSIIIWGVRVNESRSDQPLYRRTTALAKSLDDSRPTSGSMTSFNDWKETWHEDVFSMDDYHQSPDGTVQIYEPLPGVPYMISETVGQRTYTAKGFDNMYRRAGKVEVQYKQALYHAQAHDRARAYTRMGGVIAWCAFEYGSPQNSHKGIKNPGVADVFRAPKLGATFYQAQVSPSVRPVIAPNFYWDFSAETPRGPGKDAILFHNCERLELFVDGKHHASVEPDRNNYPHLLHAPSFVDLDMDGTGHPELRIDGFVGGRKVISRSFSSDPSKDKFVAAADDHAITSDGIDATRVLFQVVDQFGAPRLLGGGDVQISVAGPGVLIGDETFSLTESGGVGAVWIKSKPGSAGTITITLSHTTMGTRTVTLHAEPAARAKQV
jgi:beta-galactosidase